MVERHCYDPPDPPFGGKYTWDSRFSGGRTPFNMAFEYTCGEARLMVKYPNDTEPDFSEPIDSVSATCLWNRTWAMTDDLVSKQWLKYLYNRIAF